MKPKEHVENQFILPNPQTIQVKTQGGSSSAASEALHLILADPGIDAKSIMFDLSKMLQDNPNLGVVHTQPRVIVNSPINYSSPHTSVQGGGHLQGIAIPKRQVYDETFLEQNGSFYASGSSQCVSPRPGMSPIFWDPGHIQIKEEEPCTSGLNLSGGHTELLSMNGMYYSTEPTLAQLNSPPNSNEDLALTTLRNLEDLDCINLDLDILTSDALFHSNQFSDVKIEPGIGVNMFQWGRESHLSSSVPVSVISTGPEYQELSNLSSGGPAISPTRLTLSPSRVTLSPTGLCMSPSRTGLSPRTNLSPNSQPLSPQMQGGSISLTPRSPHSTLHELLMRQDPLVPDPIRPRSNSNQFKSAKRPIAARQRNSLSISSPLLASQLSKSAPVKTLPIEQMIWSRRDPRPHMNSVCSNAGDSSIADEVSDIMNSLSPSELNDIDSEDETHTNTEETDEELRIDEDGDYVDAGGAKKERYFWQYNVQAKGPKGQKLSLDTRIADPHQLNDIIDPVFSDSVQVHGIKHSGKARRGDGNDLTANPRKLACIGKELEKINKEINTMTPVSEVPFSTRTRSRKEKNKLASRACRLKKKAQHEANKLKLHGLDEEHNELMRSIHQVKEVLQAKWSGGLLPGAGGGPLPQEELTLEAEKILKKASRNRVAGQTTDYVNRMILKYS